MPTFSSRSTSKPPSRVINMTGACNERSDSSLMRLWSVTQTNVLGRTHYKVKVVSNQQHVNTMT